MPVPDNSVSLSDISYLRSLYGNGNPVGVFRESSRYRAKVLKRIPLGSYPTENEACRAVVRWYKERYSNEWRAVLASRHNSHVQYYERPVGGYTIVAWLYGEPVDVKIKLGRQTADYYPTLALAKWAFLRWLQVEFGMFAAVAPVFLYRVSDKFRPVSRLPVARTKIQVRA